MIALLRAEFRKLLSVRSTYIISAIALALVAFLSFYLEGFRGMMVPPQWFGNMLYTASTIIPTFVALVAILLMGHEYRYNTIMYTLTSVNSRTKVLFAKMAAIVVFALTLTLIAWALAIFAFWLGVSLSPNELQQWTAPQFEWSSVWRGLFLVVSFGLLGLLLAFLFRHLVGAIAALFILPTIEGLLSPLLKENARYLPFSVVEQVHTGTVWQPLTAAFLFTAYMAAAWLLAWYLFIRRDAN